MEGCPDVWNYTGLPVNDLSNPSASGELSEYLHLNPVTMPATGDIMVFKYMLQAHIFAHGLWPRLPGRFATVGTSG
jgi:hypothetical protein